MRFTDYLLKDAVVHEQGKLDKEEAIRLLTRVTARAAGLCEEELIEQVLERERKLSTGIGLGFAIPHCRFPATDRFCVGLMICGEGIPFDAVDFEPVKILFLIVSPENAVADNLRIISILCRILSLKENRVRLREAAGKEELLHLLREMESQIEKR